MNQLRWRGITRNASNFVFVALGTGIGAGIFVNGQLYTGHKGLAGELQFLHVEWPRWNQHFGDTGHFETHASGQGIATFGRKLMTSRTPSRNEGLAERRDAHSVFEEYRKGNAKARKVLEMTFTILAVGLPISLGSWIPR